MTRLAFAHSRPLRAAVFVSLLITPSHATDRVEPPRDPAYQLVWADEFNTAGRPDPNNWNFETGFQRNHELQWYQARNAFCEKGLLIIEARRETIPNPDFKKGSTSWRKKRPAAKYSSASLTSAGKQEWTFGRIEVRARFKALPGLWPAIWTTGNGRWPHGGEIDIMEYYKHGILANFCWAGPQGRAKWDDSFIKLENLGDPNWDQRFHLWVTEWTAETIDIHLDGKLLNSLDMKTVLNADGPRINPFLSPQYLRLNLAIGGDRGGDPANTPFPQRYEVDYVRVYQIPAKP